MKYLLLALLALCTTCCTVKKDPLSEPRRSPHYQGIDEKAKPMIDEYVKIAKTHHIKFTRPITVGFTDINSGTTVGVCFYGKKFREIEIDNFEWNSSSEETKKQLLFHELTHCLCNRGHDYFDGVIFQDYPEVGFEEYVDHLLNKWPFYRPLPGRYPDGCPTSYMFPHVLPENCVADHNKEYLQEMFYGCRTW